MKQKKIIDYVVKNTNLLELVVESLEYDIDRVLDSNVGIDRRMYFKKFSHLEQIFFLSFYYKTYVSSKSTFGFLESDWCAHQLWEEGHTPVRPLLRPQYKCGKYKIDFAIIRKYCKIAIELDGFAYHDRNVSQFNYERDRQNNLIKNDFLVFRFTWNDIVERFDEVYYTILEVLEKKERIYFGK